MNRAVRTGRGSGFPPITGNPHAANLLAHVDTTDLPGAGDLRLAVDTARSCSEAIALEALAVSHDQTLAVIASRAALARRLYQRLVYPF